MFESVRCSGRFHGALPEGEDFALGPIALYSCDQQVEVHAVEDLHQHLTDNL